MDGMNGTDETWKSDLAERLRRARGTESRAQLASRSRISERTVWLIEHQKIVHIPRDETLVRLAWATDRRPQEWLGLLPKFASDRPRLSAVDIKRLGELIHG